MTNIHVKPDCGNAPKKAFLRDFEIAFTKSDPSTILNMLSDDVYWEMIGDQVVQGKEAVAAKLPAMLDGSITELFLDTIITHGNQGAVEGSMQFQDDTIFRFCDVFTFTSHSKGATIKKLTSFVIAAKEQQYG